MIIISNIIYITILVLLLLTSVILIAKLARNSYRLHYTTILKSITDVPTPVCIVNMSNNKIIAGNELMCKLFNLDKMSDIDITSLNLFTDRFENYLDIKNICKYSNDKYHQRFIHITINNMPKIFKVKFSKIKIGYKNFIIFIINDKTEIVNYIKKLGIFTNVVDEASEGILITKFSEKENMFPIIRYANPAIKEITGYTPKQYRER